MSQSDLNRQESNMSVSSYPGPSVPEYDTEIDLYLEHIKQLKNYYIRQSEYFNELGDVLEKKGKEAAIEFEKEKHSILEKAPPKFYFDQYKKSSKTSLNQLSGIALLKKLKQFIVVTDSKLEKLPVPDSSKTYDLKYVLKILENGNHFLKSKTKQLLPEYAAFGMWLELLFIKHHGHFETFLKLKLPHYSVSQIRYFRNYGRLAKLYPKLKTLSLSIREMTMLISKIETALTENPMEAADWK